MVRLRQQGFSTVELLITLFVAAAFLVAGYQLYALVIRDGGEARAQTRAANVAQDYMNQYRSSIGATCTVSTPMSNAPQTVSGLDNVTLTVAITCPNTDAPGMSLITVTVNYNEQKTITIATYAAAPAAPLTCPSGFIPVPGNPSLGTAGGFCVMKYEASNVGGVATSQATDTPWVNISQVNARAAATTACAGCQLISEAQWMTIAASILSVPSNWSGNAVGSGSLYVGHSDNVPGNSLAPSASDSDGYNGTGNTSGTQRRTMTLSNGEVIWDFSGNVSEITTGTIAGGQLPGQSTDSAFSSRLWNTAGLLMNGLPAISQPSAISSDVATWSAQGLGRVHTNYNDTNDRAFLRGGAYNSGTSTAGILSLILSSTGTSTSAAAGFRVVTTGSNVPSECPVGFIPVPGNASLGTEGGFCIMKYEAANVSGVATSQASGSPWVNIDQADAMLRASEVCPSCHLVTEAEWMTVAGNIAGVASNWSGGSVGSGSLYIGHSDNSPANAIAASTNDASGYTNTGNSSGNQRRTLTLSNGQVIWDFSGNVGEWTTGVITANQPVLSSDTVITTKEWNNGAMQFGDFPTVSRPGTAYPGASSWSSTQGIGQLRSSPPSYQSAGYVRGGGYANNPGSGIFSLGLTNAVGASGAAIGFRVVSNRTTPSQPGSCPTGFIPVPGDTRFGTIGGFCLMKYEAVNVSGVATSQATGTPWVSISHVNARTAAKTACTDCHLVSELEWMTVAANVMNVPSNWSGGAVGSGTVFAGHSDNSPANLIAASTSDTAGYTNTGNSSGNQRRTLTLSNGQVIWDLSGNATEWTDALISGSQLGLASDSGYVQRQWTTNNLAMNNFPYTSNPASISPTAATYNAAQGIGTVQSYYNETAQTAYLRGGSFSTTVANAGIFYLTLHRGPTTSSGEIGFRSARSY